MNEETDQDKDKIESENDQLSNKSSTEKSENQDNHGELRNRDKIAAIVKDELNEQRSLETILRLQFEDYKTSIDRKIASYIVGISIIISILGFFGYQGIKDLTKSQIEKQLAEKLVTPEIHKSVADALEKETELFISNQIKPLDTRMDEVKNDVSNLESLTKSIAPELKKELRSSLQKQTNEFTENHINPLKLTTQKIKKELILAKQESKTLSTQMKSAQIESKKLSDETTALKLFFGARQGDREAFNQLTKFSKYDQTSKGKLSRTLIDDLNLYYEEYKYALAPRQNIISKKTKKYYRIPAERLHIYLFEKVQPIAMKRAAMNDIRKRNFKYFVEDLVNIVQQKDINLKVLCRAVSTLQDMTKHTFLDHPPFTDVKTWWDTEGKFNPAYKSPFDQLSKAQQLIEKKNNDEALQILKDITSKCNGLCVSHARIAAIYLKKNNKEKAKEHLKIVATECDSETKINLVYAKLLYKDREKDALIDLIKRTWPYVESETMFEITVKEKFGDLISQEEFKKIFK